MPSLELRYRILKVFFSGATVQEAKSCLLWSYGTGSSKFSSLELQGRMREK